MNYELAKELKDAGFPQEYHDCVCVGDSHGNCICYNERWEKDVMYPTLSELIEATTLKRLECSYSLDGSDNEWTAQPYSHDFNPDWCGKGKTPEEAVARLWLALYKDKGI